ncbi:histidine kinase [Lentzea sp. NBRC 102530]|uniref:sensor histidine kinase n=1 Tax=Lentzea sp. NBRC 102530 TaxID=3032201 RepID=UPI0024A5C062|nr:histidine kinase [Lentzea sp. NBRC 102530]GLY46700.1 two-component sensor histidine kinase [Lentzea sp. NBRC 102530]
MKLADEMFRPLATLVLAAVTVFQLVTRPPSLLALTWSVTAVVIAAAVTAVFALDRLSDRGQIVVVGVFVLAGAPLFALAPSTAGVAFVFLATGTAGRQLRSRHVSVALAVSGAVLAMVSTWVAEALGAAEVPPWWLGLTAGLPVYFGLVRRDRVAAQAAAEYTAVLEERGRIAREIHDVVGHSLSGIAVQLDMADALHGAGKSAEANEAVLRARALAVSGLKETRRAVHALRESTLPLTESVARLAETHGATFRSTGEGPVSVEIAQTVIRAAQEALTNAHKHAPEATVVVDLEYAPTVVRLTVTDNGTNDAQGSGMGLNGMRERAELLGGELFAGPGGPGWTVRLELPR